MKSETRNAILSCLLICALLTISVPVTSAPLEPGGSQQSPAGLTTAEVWTIEYVGQLGGYTNAVAAEGDLVYIGVGPRLIILNVADPALPAVVGKTEPMPCSMSDIAVGGGYAYLACDLAGLGVVDVSDPANPVEVGFYDTPGSTSGVDLVGTYAYLADGALRVVDISDPADPVEVGFNDTVHATDVAVAGDYAYVTYPTLGLWVVDVSNAAAPVEVGSYETPDYAYGVDAAGSYAYVAANTSGLRIIDVANPEDPVEVGVYDISDYARGVTVSGTVAYVAYCNLGLRIVDVSDPGNPDELGFYNTDGFTSQVALSGEYAYLADVWAGMRVVNISNPEAPIETGFYDMGGDAQDAVVVGGMAYVAAGDVFWLVDVSDPADPVEAAALYTPGSARGVAVVGDYAYVADYYAGLQVVNVSDPENPVEVGSCDTEGYAWDVAVQGEYAYVADGDGLRVVDVSDPENPAEVGFYDSPGAARGVAVAGAYAYLADYTALRVVNVSDPENPVEVGFYDSPGYAGDVAMADSYAYVADAGTGLRVVDVLSPADPVEVGFYDTPGWAYSVAVSGGHAYVADGEAGLRMVDLSDPEHPVEVGFYDTQGSAAGAAVDGEYTYVADGAGGLLILRPANDCPAPLTEVSVSGPATGYTGVSYDFGGTITPADATEPVTYLWSPEPDTGQGTASASYTFDLPDAYSVTLIAENCGGAASDMAYTIIISDGETAVVDPDTGATLIYIDAQGNDTSIEVPPDAVTESIVLTLEPVDSVSPPGGLAFASHALDLTAYLDGQPLVGFTFEIPIQATVDYSDADVAGLDESTLDLQYWTGSEWSTDGITIVSRDTANNQLDATIAHLSRFALFAEYQYRLYLPLIVRQYP